MPVLEKICCVCKKKFFRYLYGHHINSETLCCNKKCAALYLSRRMTLMNFELNPSRMNIETRNKVSEGHKRIKKAKKHTYKKYLGRHIHRIEAEKMLGRKLKRGEVVHHKDENKHNNNHDNLIVFRSQSEHAKYHALKSNFGKCKKHKK